MGKKLALTAFAVCLICLIPPLTILEPVVVPVALAVCVIGMILDFIGF